MLQVSSGYVEQILGPRSFLDIFTGGAIAIYNGSRPASANDAPSSLPIAWVTNIGLPWTPGNLGAGLNFVQDRTFILNDPTQRWVCRASDALTAVWFRQFSNAPDEDFGPSYTHARIDGDISLIGGTGELQLATLSLLPTTPFAVGFFLYTIPPILGA